MNQRIIKNCYLLSLCLVVVGATYGQQPKKYTSGEIYAGIEKLGFLGSALFVAAHPDDENTRVISFLANDKKAFTTYLSLTRGDGGQNLIGSEVSELLGAIRTQELLMARSVDNGRQMFTRANDFGYSKNAEETIKIWDTDKVKADVVWAIRKLRPDVIINRFDHRTSGTTHGHHTASGILSHELFDKTNDPTIYPEQLKYVKPWQPQRLFFNTSWWFYGSEEKFKNADKSKLMSLDVGVYFPLLGKSNTEIAAESRSMHKCQGFGSTGSRGTSIEYLELLKGDLPATKSDVFEGINTTWSRIKGAANIQILVENARKNFDFTKPYASIPALVDIYNKIQKVDDEFWRDLKTVEVKELIAQCAGMYAEAKINTHRITPGEDTKLDLEIINRSPALIKLISIQGKNVIVDTVFNFDLLPNETVKWSRAIKIPENTPLTAPYWLTKKGSLGLYNVENQTNIGLPETPKTLGVDFVFNIAGTDITYSRNAIYKFNSPENGETYRPLEVVPQITLGAKEPVYIFNSDKPREVTITVKAWTSNQKGEVTLGLPDGWTSEPVVAPFDIATKGDGRDLVFKVFGPNQGQEIVIHPTATSNGKTFAHTMIDIPYEHIPYQSVLKPSETKLSKINIEILGNRIAYIAGAGDDIPVSLRQIGYDVQVIKAEDVSVSTLKSFHALVVGVRAYNTEEPLKFKQKEILAYVEQGGTVVAQYNTAGNMVTKELGPYPFTISRNRVTVEEAEMRFLQPEHPILNFPNKITQTDFQGWVQERGLYFAADWDPKYTTILSCNDPGEAPQDGSVIVADYGKGRYIYTGLSFFRELPAGVAGAFRLFANMISYGYAEKP